MYTCKKNRSDPSHLWDILFHPTYSVQKLSSCYCPFKTGIHRSKTKVILHHSSGANLFPTLTSRMAEGNDRSASQSILVADFLNRISERGPSQDFNFRIILVRVLICFQTRESTNKYVRGFSSFQIILVRMQICFQTRESRKLACQCRQPNYTVRKPN